MSTSRSEILLAGECMCKSNVKPAKVSKRYRKSPYPMISVPEAVETILKESYLLSAEWKYFKAGDTSEVRKVIGTVTPGCQLDFDLKLGCCVRVSTGSAIPDKADAVIQVEDTSVVEEDEEGNEISIKIEKIVEKHQDIRPIGSDVSKDEILIPEGHKISAAEIGVLATCGILKVFAYQKPMVALLSTGDEVLEPGTPLRPGCIRDSNKSSLQYMLYENGISTFDAGIARDFADDIKTKLISAFRAADIIVTTGSVSMGEKDILKQVLEIDFDAVVHFGRVHMKPGKPTTFSTAYFEDKEKLIFSLPGNPVSALVCFYLFVIPCIKKLMGFKEPRHATIKVELVHDISLDERPEFYRVFLKYNDNGIFLAHSTGGQQSSRLLSLQQADALLVLPPKSPQFSLLKAGSKVDAILIKRI
ncbi:Gephyrin like protein [Argiope bruennichi]|uniref:Gephyrin like protein n=1 Tax=Argiope bruennichi TaxID=94029 RepID=A0A8T0F4H6_ARGBR|nr:Gephyrin like protein [Argiope bruennichi]